MHYKCGTEAKVGDLVKGTTYNQPNIIVGTVLGITPGSETCNCRVGFLRAQKLDFLPKTGVYTATLNMSRELTGVFQRDNETDPNWMTTVVDYSECKALELVHRPPSA